MAVLRAVIRVLATSLVTALTPRLATHCPSNRIELVAAAAANSVMTMIASIRVTPRRCWFLNVRFIAMTHNRKQKNGPLDRSRPLKSRDRPVRTIGVKVRLRRRLSLGESASRSRVDIIASNLCQTLPVLRASYWTGNRRLPSVMTLDGYEPISRK